MISKELELGKKAKRLSHLLENKLKTDLFSEFL